MVICILTRAKNVKSKVKVSECVCEQDIWRPIRKLFGVF